MKAINKIPPHKTPSAADYNKLADRLNILSKITGRNGVSVTTSPMGITLRGSLAGDVLGDLLLSRLMKIYEVQTASSGDGLYNCKLMKLDATEWDDTDGTNKYVYADEVFEWAIGINYAVNALITHDSVTYICIKAHLSAVANEPPNSNFWMKIYDWGVAVDAWDDGHGAYSEEDRVTYLGKHYICILTHTAAIGKEPTEATWWDETYVLNDVVTYEINGTDNYFKCISTHVSDAAKTPENTTYWENMFSKEIFNLLENHPVALYTAALGLYDKINAWKTYDDEGNVRWMGMPISGSVRRVRTFEAAPAATNITCNLILNNDVEAAEGELGYNIEVSARISGGGNLNAAVPRLANDNYAFAQNIQGKWWFVTVFNSSENCTCS